MESGNLLEIGIDDPTDLGLFLGVRRIVAIIGVTNETIFDTKSVKCFGETRCKRNDARGIHRNADRAAVTVGDFAHRRGSSRRGARLRGKSADAKEKETGAEGRSVHDGPEFHLGHESPLARVRENCSNKKAPYEGRLRTGVLSREEHAAAAVREGSLAYGDLPITVAGPRPVCTALPRFPNLQIVDSVYGPRAGVSTKRRGGVSADQSFLAPSDFSNWVCASRPTRAGLPASLPGDTARSRRYSWNSSGRRAEKGPCPRESLSWPL